MTMYSEKEEKVKEFKLSVVTKMGRTLCMYTLFMLAVLASHGQCEQRRVRDCERGESAISG